MAGFLQRCKIQSLKSMLIIIHVFQLNANTLCSFKSVIPCTSSTKHCRLSISKKLLAAP